MAESYYSTLGVKTDATRDEINQAYRKLARKWHPDIVAQKIEAQALSPEESGRKRDEAKQKYEEINQAYRVLSNPDKKSHYDTLLNADMPQDKLEQYRKRLKELAEIKRVKRPTADARPIIKDFGDFSPLFSWYYNKK